MTEFVELMSQPFVQRALIVGILIALCSSLLGITLVLKRFSFIGDGLSHVAFGAMSIASIFSIANEMLFVLPITIICAIILLKSSQTAKIKGDASIAMISVSALAIGYLFMNVFKSSSNVSGDVCNTLFGSMAFITLSETDLWLCIGLSLAVILVFVLFYNKIFTVTFDESFAKATGVKTDVYNLIIAVIVAVVIVVAMQLVGSLLVSALVIFPALSSMRIFKSFKSVTICSAIISVFCALCGMLISIAFSTPVGATIVIFNLFVFIIFSIVGTSISLAKK